MLEQGITPWKLLLSPLLPAFDAEKLQALGGREKIIANNLSIFPSLCHPTAIYISDTFFFYLFIILILLKEIELAVEFEKQQQQEVK